MVRVVALARAAEQDRMVDALRFLIVCGCAFALIVAGRALPF
jgi:hypothetical protein